MDTDDVAVSGQARTFRPASEFASSNAGLMGHEQTLGSRPHSGLSYMSLIPRVMASIDPTLNRRSHQRKTMRSKRPIYAVTGGAWG